jgi:hypothetical protein
MKPPTATTPSGDRAVARALMAAMSERGHTVELASRLRSREPLGDADRQRRLRDVGAQLADRLVRRYRRARPDVWFTYHLYYKAPDWIGPRVADALAIPYVLAEASYAPKRAAGPWHESHAAVEHAIRRSDLVFGLNPANDACVTPLLKESARLIPLRPFVANPMASKRKSTASKTNLMALAMMRMGAKLASYRLLADALRLLPLSHWTLTIIGDGPAEPEVRAAFAGLPVTFVGQQDPASYFADADLLVWPALDEAFGMAIVEAQAAGIPVVCGFSPGVAAIVRDGETGLLVPQGDARAFADAVAELIANPARRTGMGAAGAANALNFNAAADLIDEKLRALA